MVTFAWTLCLPNLVLFLYFLMWYALIISLILVSLSKVFTLCFVSSEYLFPKLLVLHRITFIQKICMLL
jgi:hypothetical protein